MSQPVDQNCSVCKFWVSGWCKRFPPILILADPSSLGAAFIPKAKTYAFPVTLKDDWCGEWAKQ